MARYLVVENDVVTNIVNFDPDTPEKNGWVLAPDGQVGIGWKRNNKGVFRRPDPVKEEPPATVAAINLRRIMRREGVKQSFEFAVEGCEEPEKEFWQYSTEISRNDPSLAIIIEKAGITSDQMDEYFRLAK